MIFNIDDNKKCDPLCEVLKSNYDITSIKVWFLPLIKIFDITQSILKK